MTRLTYKSAMGDYGSVFEYTSKNDEIQALRNQLGKYEDLFDEENTIPFQEYTNERLFVDEKMQGLIEIFHRTKSRGKNNEM